MKYDDIIIRIQAEKCLLCHEPACSKACPYNIPCGEIIRSLRFENDAGARSQISDTSACRECTNKSCMQACRRSAIDSAVEIPKVLQIAAALPLPVKRVKDLSVDFCGVHCENPFFLSSSVVSNNYEMVAKAFDMGWAGVAFKTIGTFVPQEVSPRFAAMRNGSASFTGFKNIEQISDHSLVENLDYLKQLKEEYPTKIIIASIMGQSEEEWTYLAGVMEKAGADIVECNFSCPHMTQEGLGSDIGTHPDLVAKFTKAAKKGTKLPVLAKMTPNITNMEMPSKAAVNAGADGIAAINTIKSIMNVHPDDFGSEPYVKGKSAVGGYSGKAVKPIALRFIQDIKNCRELATVPISGMGGIETWKDAVEFISLGCGTVQVTTSVMQYGYRIIDDLIDGLAWYMGSHGISSVNDLMGRALKNLVPADELERNSICYPKFDRSKCVGCLRCYLSCYDGGHQALRINEATGQPFMDGKKCVGCHLCVTVCPAGAITPGVRAEK